MTAQTVLLTGYPSFAARHMLGRLIREDNHVVLLVREKLLRQARTHLDALGLPAEREQVEILVGDVMDLDLGLSGAEILRLLEEVRVFYHMAEISFLGAARDMIWRVNVDGTRNALDVAASMQALDRFVFLSTAFVSGTRQGVIREEELDEGQTFRNELERSKMTAERLCRAAMATVPITVVRPSLVVGDTRTGAIDRTDGPYSLIQAMISLPLDLRLPLPGRGDHPLNMVPIDYVVDAIYALANDKEAGGRTFHLTDPNPLSARQVFEIVAEKAGRRAPRNTLAGMIAHSLLRIPGIERLSRATRQFIDQFDQLVIYNNSAAMRVLSQHGLVCPPFETYAEHLVEHVRRLGEDAGEHEDARVRPPARRQADRRRR